MRSNENSNNKDADSHTTASRNRSNSRSRSRKNSSHKRKSQKIKKVKILIPCSDKIKLIDFGGATFDDEHHGLIINTRQYRAPEVILCKIFICINFFGKNVADGIRKVMFGL